MNEAIKKERQLYDAKYKKLNYKQIHFDVQKEYFNDVLKPAADKVGEPISAFIKKSITQRIEREGLMPEVKNKEISEDLLPIIEDAYIYIRESISNLSWRPDWVKKWEDRMDLKIRTYLRGKYELSKYERDLVIGEVEKRYWKRKKDG